MHTEHRRVPDWDHWPAEQFAAAICLAAIILYACGMLLSHSRGKPFPLYRCAWWFLAILSAAAAVTGPLAERAHTDFTAHMLAHLLLGMLAPLLAALAAPFTLLYRTIPVYAARRLTRMLKCRPIRILSDPLTASILHVGGLWVLYATPLYEAMHRHVAVYAFVHMHVFLAGCLFTAAIMPIDPSPHRTGFRYRAAVLLLATAGHSILAKYLYSHPPSGITQAQAEAGSVLMYYGGDAVGAIVIAIFCRQWYRAARPRQVCTVGQACNASKQRLSHQLLD